MKHKICKGKIYVTTMPILGVLKHFVEDFKLQFIEKTGMNKKCFFPFHCARLALSLNKIGNGSAMKIKKMLFSFHCARLALSLNKIGGGSAMKIKKCFFSFHCARLALSLHIN